MSELVALALPGGPAFVAALQRIWERGDAAFPLDLRLPRPAREAALAAVGATRLLGPDGHEGPLAAGWPARSGDALVVATSGTTGTPRGVVLTHDAVAASAHATSAWLEVDPRTDRWLACLPLSHVGGLSVVTRALLTGTPLTILPGFDAGAVEEAAAAGATLVSLVPTTLARIDPTRFRRVLVGGASPPERPAPNVVTTYGLTETGSGVVYDGRPLAGVEVDLRADGEVAVRGPMLLRAYRDGVDPKTPDGWLRTGDVGAWDPLGRLVVHGRRGEMIVTGGEKVWPAPVEAVLAGVPGVAEVAVAGRPDREWGQRVVAFVVPDRAASPPPDLAQLRAAVKERLPAYAAPRELVVVANLPRTALGKVRRDHLAAGTGADRETAPGAR